MDGWMDAETFSNQQPRNTFKAHNRIHSPLTREALTWHHRTKHWVQQQGTSLLKNATS